MKDKTLQQMGSAKSYHPSILLSKCPLFILLILVFSCQARAQLVEYKQSDSVISKCSLDSLAAQLDLVSDKMNLSQYRDGLLIIESVLEKMNQFNGIPDFYIVDAWLKAASLYSLLDEYEKALSTCNKALIHSKKCFGELSDQYAQALDLLSFIYYQRGDLDKALLLGLQSCELFSKIPYTPNYIYALNDLAAYYFDSGNYENAIAIGLQVQSKALSEWGSNNAFYINSLNNQARFYAGTGDVDNAILYSEEALRTCVETGQIKTYSYARSLEHLANYYYLQSNNLHAINYAETALPLLDSLFGNCSFEYINVERDLARFYIGIEEYEKASEYIKDLEKKVENTIIRAFSTMPSRERAMYWNWYNEWYYYYLPCYCKQIGSDELFAMLYNASLFSKGLLLATDIEERKLYDNNNNKGVLFELHRAIKESDNLLYQNLGITQQQDSINQVIDSLNLYLDGESSYFSSFIESQRVRWEDIQKKMKNNEIAIEFIKIEEGTKVYYAALTIKKDYDVPRFTVLFDYDDLCNIPQETYYWEPSLGRMVWGNLLEEMAGSNSVLFSPTGIFQCIGIENIPISDSETISDLYSLYRLTSTKAILQRDYEIHHSKSILYGGLNYDYHLLDSIDERINESKDTIPFDLYRGISQRGGFKEIPKTLQEVTEIASMLADSYLKCEVYTNNSGTEQSLRELSGSAINILHIASHADYIPFDKMVNRKMITDNLLESDNYIYSVEDVAMTRSFLVFAGVNSLLDSVVEITDQKNDGVLTAMEISELYFQDLDLVVLSACNTGLGALSEDGVIGLQRGFKKAGAKSILMSLWKVDDKATELLMVEFYRNYLSGVGKAQSLKNAQKYVRDYTDKNGDRIYKYPYYWAGFVLLDALN